MRPGTSVQAASLAVALLLLAPAARADVLQSGPGGFAVQHRVVLALAPDKAWTRLGHIQEWWDPKHTYSGASRNLSLRLSPGGCFCEKLSPDGFVKHMEVVLVRPREQLRLVGGLGPLQELGVSGALTFDLAPKDGRTEVTLTYRVSGSGTDGLEKLAAVVDQVLGEQLERYAAPATR